MPAGLTAATRDSMLDQAGTLIGYLSLHTADPSTTGANEVSGGSPAYARKATTWNASSGGSKTAATLPTFDVPAGTTVAYVGYWSAVTGGTFRGSALVTSETYAGQGTYTPTSVTLTAS
jgi:hypothetical protein